MSLFGRLPWYTRLMYLFWAVMVIYIDSLDTPPDRFDSIVGGLGFLLLAFVTILSQWFYYRPIRDRLEFDFDRSYARVLVIGTILMLPMFLAALSFLGLDFFGASCNPPKMRDYTMLALDSLAKGMLLDFMESYDLHIYRCKPNAVISAQTVIFLIRTFSSVILLWFVARVYRSWRRSKQSA
jgi:hypothetical protein